MNNRISSYLDNRRCATATWMLLALIVATAFLPPRGRWESLVRMLFFLMLIFAPYLIGRSVKILRACLFLGIFTIPSWLLYSDDTISAMLMRPAWLDMTMLPLLMGVAVFLTGVVSYRALAGKFTGERIFSCILTFLLIGVAFANVYLLMLQHYPGSFAVRVPEAAIGINDMLYFSFTTLTTCGYGDILPNTAAARMLASLEMVTGVLFVAIFIAGMLRDHEQSSESQSGDKVQ